MSTLIGKRPSAALVLGVLSGMLAALTFLPTVIPVIRVIQEAEQALALRQAHSAADHIVRYLRGGVVVTEQTRMELGAELIHVLAREPIRAGETVYLVGGGLHPEDYDELCEDGNPQQLYSDRAGKLWAVACIETNRHLIVAADRLDFNSPRQVVYVMTLLALFVGIITALGILRLLSPLSEVSRAIRRVGAGHRGVRMTGTGLAELDELVDRLNAAARAMEDREDAILARIQVVQEMARLVAHEIRNPLQSLELQTSLIAAEDDAHERNQIAGAIHTEIRNLDMVVQRLLRDSASAGALRLSVAHQPVAPLLDQILTLHRPQANARGVQLALGPLVLRAVPIDPALLSRSIENLVQNALQVVRPGVGKVELSLFEEDPWLEIVVDDNGPGVDPALAAHVFDPNVSGRIGGTGLGLSLVKGVVEAHGGYIEHGQSPLGGARFVARIPLKQSSGDEVDQALA